MAGPEAWHGQVDPPACKHFRQWLLLGVSRPTSRLRLVDQRPHLRLHAMLGELREIDLVHARVLVLVFDLVSAIPYADVTTHDDLALPRREWILQATKQNGEVA